MRGRFRFGLAAAIGILGLGAGRAEAAPRRVGLEPLAEPSIVAQNKGMATLQVWLKEQQPDGTWKGVSGKVTLTSDLDGSWWDPNSDDLSYTITTDETGYGFVEFTSFPEGTANVTASSPGAVFDGQPLRVEFVEPGESWFWADHGKAPAAGDRAGAESKPVRKHAGTYRKDEWLQKRVSLDTTKGFVQASTIVKFLTRQTGVTLRLEPDLTRRRLALRIEERPAWEVMDALAALLGAGWEPVGEVYVLVTDPELAPATAVSGQERATDMGRKFDALLGSLTPAQWERLEQAKRLPLDEDELTLAQQELVREMTRQAHFSTDVWQRPPDQTPGGLMLQFKSDGRETTGLGLYLRFSDGNSTHITSKYPTPGLR